MQKSYVASDEMRRFVAGGVERMRILEYVSLQECNALLHHMVDAEPEDNTEVACDAMLSLPREPR